MKVIQYASFEGGDLYNWIVEDPIIAALDLVAEKSNGFNIVFDGCIIHALIFDTGDRWDCINGINKRTERSNTS